MYLSPFGAPGQRCNYTIFAQVLLLINNAVYLRKRTLGVYRLFCSLCARERQTKPCVACRSNI